MRFHGLGTGRVRSALLLIGLLGALPDRPAWAQAGDAESGERLNYAFASELGSGVYNLSGHTIQIYRLPLFFPVRNVEEKSPGIRVDFPVCLGFFDLDSEDVEGTGEQEDVAMASFVPGVALEFVALPNWTLEPFVELGVARNFHDPGGAYVYAIGLGSLARFSPREFELLLGNRLLYLGEHTPGVEMDEDYAKLETGLELRHPLGLAVKGHGLDWGPYSMIDVYFQPTKVWIEDKPLDVGRQYEVGFTVGTKEPVVVWRFELPRIGLGYRFGDGVSAVRLVLGAAF